MTVEQANNLTEEPRGLLFVAIARCAKWDVLHPGGETTRTDKPRWEVLALPGGLVGYGSTREEASKRLAQTINFAIQQSGESKLAWWKKSLNSLREEKRRLLEKSWVKLLAEQRLQDRGGILYGDLEEQDEPGLLAPNASAV